jgi:hypothetical protein
MNGIFDILYIVVLLSYLLLSLFIIYHILRYSGNRAVMIVTLIFFVVGTFLLITSNIAFYSEIPFDTLTPELSLPNNTLYTPQNPFGVQK